MTRTLALVPLLLTVIGEPPVPIAEVPTLGSVGLAALLLLLAAAGMVLLRQRSRA